MDLLSGNCLIFSRGCLRLDVALLKQPRLLFKQVTSLLQQVLFSSQYYCTGGLRLPDVTYLPHSVIVLF